ncbi:MAG: hypothetical protein U1F51_06025 [Burkholderiales bacterium]
MTAPRRVTVAFTGAPGLPRGLRPADRPLAAGVDIGLVENMLAPARAGAMIPPPVPPFYGRPATSDARVDFVVARVLDPLRVPHVLGPRRGEGRDAPPSAETR